jgi:hypothetical protein
MYRKLELTFFGLVLSPIVLELRLALLNWGFHG